MPIYEDEAKLTLAYLQDLCKKMKCQECGGRLNIFMDGGTSKAYLACKDWNRTHHNGIKKEG